MVCERANFMNFFYVFHTQILNRTNNIFELVTVNAVMHIDSSQNDHLRLKENESEDENEKKLRLKGQMIYMNDWRLIMFLGTPV